MKTLTLVLAMLSLLGFILMGWEYTHSKELKEGTVMSDQYRTATLAGGCFWCVESDFEKVGGVVEVISGYTGGSVENPTYQQVSAGREVQSALYVTRPIFHRSTEITVSVRFAGGEKIVGVVDECVPHLHA